VSLRVELFDKSKHDRAAFDSGSEPLDRWFQKSASQDSERNFARVHVAVDEQGVVGFYSLSTISIDLGDLPETLRKRLPRYSEVPAILMGRLAVHRRVQRQGIGTVLLGHALGKAMASSQQIAAYAVVVDAKSEAVALWYESFGFQPLTAGRLFMPMVTAATAALSASASEPRTD